MFDIFPIKASVWEYVTWVLYLWVYYDAIKSPAVADDPGAMQDVACGYGTFSQRNWDIFLYAQASNKICWRQI